MRVEELVTVTFPTARPLKLTVVDPWAKFVPVMVSEAPTPAGEGEIPIMVGA